MFVYENKIEAPASAELEIGLRDMAMDAGVDIMVNTVKTGLLFKRDHVYFKATSKDRGKVETFVNSVIAAAEQYEQDTTPPGISGYGISGLR